MDASSAFVCQSFRARSGAEAEQVTVRRPGVPDRGSPGACGDADHFASVKDSQAFIASSVVIVFGFSSSFLRLAEQITFELPNLRT
jgi:hypothetical protein